MFSGKELTGIDIGTNSIKVVKAVKKNLSVQLKSRFLKKIPYQTIVEGRSFNDSIVSRHLEEIFNSIGKPGIIITTIPSNNLIIRNMQFPLMTDKELKEAVKWEVGDYLPFSVEDAVLEYIILDKDNESIDLLLVMVKKQVVEDYISPITSLGLKPAVVNIQPMAILSLLQYQGKLDKTAVVVDIGASGTRIIIGDHKNIYHSRTVDSGGEEFTKIFMEEKDYSFNEAEEFKIHNGIKEKGSTDTGVDLAYDQIAAAGLGINDLLISSACNIVNEISRSLDYYVMKYKYPIENVFITGGGSKLSRLKDMITKELDIELTNINPFEGFGLDKVVDVNAEKYAVAVGLILSEVLENEN